jgi:hypothetical protein
VRVRLLKVSGFIITVAIIGSVRKMGSVAGDLADCKDNWFWKMYGIEL